LTLLYNLGFMVPPTWSLSTDPDDSGDEEWLAPDVEEDDDLDDEDDDDVDEDEDLDEDQPLGEEFLEDQADWDEGDTPEVEDDADGEPS